LTGTALTTERIMTPRRLIFALLLLAAVVAPFGLITLGSDAVQAQDAKDTKKITTLATMRLNDVDGKEVELDGDDLRGSPVVFCFLSTWSPLSIRQAQAVKDAAKDYKGRLVFVCGGPERKARGLREDFGGKAGGLWLKADAGKMNDFTKAFDPAVTLDRLPALIVIDAQRKVLHASMGELTAAEIKDAVAGK
jgi:hypothetical protein